jgi:hypothetical protein
MYVIGLILLIVVVSIVVATRRKDAFHSQSGAEGASSARRIWLYLITLISLGIFAGGVGQLLALLFEVTIRGSYVTQIGSASFNQEQLALGLAMTVIGGPLWFFFWRAVQRRVKGNEEEIGDVSRKLFLNFILLETAIMSITTAGDFLKWLIAGAKVTEFASSSLAIPILGGAIWFYHWWVSENEGYPSSVAKTLRRWYVYVLSSFGLVWLAVGVVQLINAAVVNLPVWGNTLVRGQFWDINAQTGVSMLLLGGITWYFHWFRMAKGDYDSTLRQIYFYLLTISGGAIAALVASTILLFRVFLWVFGETPIPTTPYFQFLGWAVPTILVGLAIWGYHRRLVELEAGRVQEKRLSAQRIYFYLMSFLGLGTIVAGLSLLFGVLLDLIINSIDTTLVVTSGWWRNQLSLFLALILIGSPIWVYYWRGILKRVQAGGIEEWRAMSRRVFLYVVVGASIVMLAADMVNIIYQLLNGLLQGNTGADILRSSKWSLQTLLVMAPLFWYHWQILRTDQRRGAESVVVRRNVTLFTDDRTGELASQFETKLGFKIRSLYRTGETSEVPAMLSDEETNKLIEEIKSSPSNKVLLLVLGGKATVLPYQDK